MRKAKAPEGWLRLPLDVSQPPFLPLQHPEVGGLVFSDREKVGAAFQKPPRVFREEDAGDSAPDGKSAAAGPDL
jgi:hypothetical protein